MVVCHRSGKDEFYLNGTKISETSYTRATDISGSIANYWGSVGSWSTGSEGVTGYIAEAKIWNRALSQAEITAENSYLSGLVNYLVFYAPLASSKSTAETGQTLTENGNPTFTTVSGVPCVFLNGVNQYIVSPSDDFPYGNNAMTFSCFFNVSEPGTGGTSAAAGSTLFIYGSGLEHCRAMYVKYSDGSLCYSNGMSDPVVYNQNLYDGAWHHVVMTMENSNLVMYLDGTQVGTASYTSDTTQSFDLFLGRWFDYDFGHYLKGYLSEVKILSKAVDQAWVTAEYARLSNLVEA